MTLPISTLRPGFLVAVKTSTSGNVSYRHTEIEPEHIDSDGVLRAVTETEKTVQDAAEHDLAIKTRSKAITILRGVCSRSAFGLLCPEKDRDQLDAAIIDARRVVDLFNSTATVERISVNVLIGRIAADDVEATKAINSEVRDLIAQMERGVAKLDPAVIREAANKAKNLGKMLSAEAAARVQVAIDASRKVASQITKLAETAAAEVDQSILTKLAEARLTFLDMDDADAAQAPVEVARSVDLDNGPVVEDDDWRDAKVTLPEVSIPGIDF